MPVSFRRSGTIAFVEMDNPPVNAIGQELRQGLADALARVAQEDGLDRVVLAGKGQVFAAGGDAREFNAPSVAPHLPDIVAGIETSSVPWIAAIGGVALGGGLELALGCRYRIAAPGASVGLPEVTLGVVPGAGGTQRLPRLLGLKAALEMIAYGRPIKASAARDMGVIDKIAVDPVAQAATLNLALLADREPLSTLPGPNEDADAIAATRAGIAKKMAHQIAPQRAVDLVVDTVTMPFGDGMAKERDTFLALRQSEQAQALRHIFFAERAAKAPDTLRDIKTPQLAHCVVVGGGTMGAGIAYALLNTGLRTTILETDSDGVTRARENVERIIAASLRRGLIDEAGAMTRRRNFAASDDYANAANADLAVEAAFESMAVKASVFAALEQVMRPDAVLATNTSYLDINQIAAGLQDPSRLLGLHFFAPAHIMKLLEIVQGAATAPGALALGFALAKRLRKIPVLAGVCDGFIGNRILARYREAADTLLMDATNPWELDEVMVGFGYAIGPYEAQDLSGLDIAYANRRRQDATRDPARRYVPIADRMVQEGRLGRKTSVGWYRYPGGGGKVIDPLIEDLVREEAYFAKVERAEMPDAEICRRLLLAMINEAAAILGEGIAQSARDIDLVTVFGYGFPRWRGGLMCYADTLGAQVIFTQLAELAKEDPLCWTPSPVITACAETGKLFAEYRPSDAS